MIEITLQLDFRNNRWYAHNQQISINADELSGLDAQINDYLTKNYQKGKYKIRYYFDFNNFPLWMRQYMPHYFNRETVFELKAIKYQVESANVEPTIVRLIKDER